MNMNMNMDIIINSKVCYIKSNDCGYCHGRKQLSNSWSLDSFRNELKYYCNSTSFGFNVYKLSTKMYENLINNGFRRSGSYIYRPDLLRTCCRAYTIRTNLDMIKCGKEHRHALNKFYNFIVENEDVIHHKNSNRRNEKFNLVDKFLEFELHLNLKNFRTEIGPNNCTVEKFNLYKKYQIHVHNEAEDKLTMSGFKRFLCNNPFTNNNGEELHNKTFWKHVNDNWKNGKIDNLNGPIHECYYFKDKLIAISVLDLLPDSVSAVYFIWDPDFSKLGLGTISALREIVMTSLLKKSYYYLGYYIQDCLKMKYKEKFGGEILDVESGDFIQLDRVKDLISGGKYCVFEDGANGNITDIAEFKYGYQVGTEFNKKAKFTDLLSLLGIDETNDEDSDDNNENDENDDNDNNELAYLKPISKTEVMELPVIAPGLTDISKINEAEIIHYLNNVFYYRCGSEEIGRVHIDDPEEVKENIQLNRLLNGNGSGSRNGNHYKILMFS